MLLFRPSWSCAIICCIIWFTSLCKNFLNLLEFLAEAFRCHMHHFQCMTVTVTVKHWKWCSWHKKASAKSSSKLNKFLHSEVNQIIQHILSDSFMKAIVCHVTISLSYKPSFTCLNWSLCPFSISGTMAYRRIVFLRYCVIRKLVSYSIAMSLSLFEMEIMYFRKLQRGENLNATSDYFSEPTEWQRT